jgi:rhodanese-related sulfurtransferase
MPRNTLALFFAIVVTAGFLQIPFSQATSYTDITAKTAYQAITSGVCPNLVILDVRTRAEFDEGHIRKALLIPHSELEERIDELTEHKNHEIIVYCFCGMRSTMASGILDAHGFTKVYNMIDGFNAWTGQGYPIATSYLTQMFFGISPNPARTTQDITLKGILTDQFSQPVAGQTVKLYYREYCSERAWQYAFAINTNAYGAFFATGKIRKSGIYEVAVYYPGSSYLESSYHLATLLVQP